MKLYSIKPRKRLTIFYVLLAAALLLGTSWIVLQMRGNWIEALNTLPKSNIFFAFIIFAAAVYALILGFIQDIIPAFSSSITLTSESIIWKTAFHKREIPLREISDVQHYLQIEDQPNYSKLIFSKLDTTESTWVLYSDWRSHQLDELVQNVRSVLRERGINHTT